MTAQRTRQHPLAVHDAALSPVLRSVTSTNPRRIALAVATPGIALGLTESTIRRWLVLRDGESLASVTSTPQRFHPVYVTASAYCEASSDLAARRKTAAARASALVGLLLSPAPESKSISAHRQAQARRALSVVGADIVAAARDRGHGGVLVHQATLAVRLGVTKATVRAMLGTCVEAGWLAHTRTMPGGAKKYAMPSRIPRLARDTAWLYVDAVNAVAEGRLDVDPVADLVLHAAHPAWGHAPGHGSDALVGSRRDGKVWLYALAAESEVDPATLGLGRAAAKTGREAWLAMLFNQDADVPLVNVLDADAQATGADVRAAEADAQRRVEVAARMTQLEEHRVVKGRARAGMESLLAKHPIPKPTGPNESRREWLDAMAAAINGSAWMTDKLRVEFAKALTSRMQAKSIGYDSEKARYVGRLIAGLPEKPKTAAA